MSEVNINWNSVNNRNRQYFYIPSPSSIWHPSFLHGMDNSAITSHMPFIPSFLRSSSVSTWIWFIL
jgi:hypothetical protein